MANDVVLTVNGVEYDKWTSVEIRDGMQEVPSFSLGLTHPNADTEPPPIQEGDECTIKVDGELILTGYVDVANDDESFDDEGKLTHKYSVEGRAKTGDVVDCAAIYEGGLFKNQKAQTILELVCEPFGVEIEVEPTLQLDPLFTKPIPRLKIENGSTAWEIITEILRRKAVLALTTAEGNFLITRAAKTPLVGVAFERGVNCKSHSWRGDSTQLFSEYIFKAQKTSSDSENGKDSAHLKGVIKDGAVKRYRPMVVVSEFAGNREDLGKRAQWERNTRRARSETIDITTSSWRNPQASVSIGFDPYAASAIVGASLATVQSGNVVSINTLPKYVNKRLGYDDVMLIQSRILRKDMNGTSTQISLTGREAFDMLEPPAARKKRKRKK